MVKSLTVLTVCLKLLTIFDFKYQASSTMFNPKPSYDSSYRLPGQCIWLKLNGCWPLKNSVLDSPSPFAAFYTLWSYYVIFSVGITIYFQSVFLVHNLNDIIMTTENCCTTFMGLLNFIRIVHLRVERTKFKNIIKQFVQHIWIERYEKLNISFFFFLNIYI